MYQGHFSSNKTRSLYFMKKNSFKIYVSNKSLYHVLQICFIWMMLRFTIISNYMVTLLNFAYKNSFSLPKWKFDTTLLFPTILLVCVCMCCITQFSCLGLPLYIETAKNAFHLILKWVFLKIAWIVYMQIIMTLGLSVSENSNRSVFSMFFFSVNKGSVWR
jgi:hypothetical protein